MSDVFINSIIIKIIKTQKTDVLDVIYHYPMSMQLLESYNSNILKFRIGNFLSAKLLVSYF